MSHDHCVGPAETIGVNEEFSRIEETVSLRNGLNWNHDENKQFLHTLVHRLVFAVGQVKTDDLGTCKELHDDRAGDDGTNAEVHDGTGSTGHDGTETAEQVERLSRQTEQQHVGHREVNAQHQEGGRDLVAEAHVMVWLFDGRVDVNEAVQGVQPAALVPFVEEAGDGGRCTKAKDVDADENESNGRIVAAPCLRTCIPCSDTDERQPAEHFSVASNDGDRLEGLRHLDHKTGEEVEEIDHSESDAKERGLLWFSGAVEFLPLPPNEHGEVKHGRCDVAGWNGTLLHGLTLVFLCQVMRS